MCANRFLFFPLTQAAMSIFLVSFLFVNSFEGIVPPDCCTIIYFTCPSLLGIQVAFSLSLLWKPGIVCLCAGSWEALPEGTIRVRWRGV